MPGFRPGCPMIYKYLLSHFSTFDQYDAQDKRRKRIDHGIRSKQLALNVTVEYVGGYRVVQNFWVPSLQQVRGARMGCTIGTRGPGNLSTWCFAA
jgi:hypothetical protein